MQKTAHDTSVEHFARELRERRGYMQERAPIVSARERWIHLAVIGAIAAVMLLGKAASLVPLSADSRAGAVAAAEIARGVAAADPDIRTGSRVRPIP